VAITITPGQRDALYEQILDHMSGIGDVWIAVSAEDYETAGRLGREYSDELRLLLGRARRADRLSRRSTVR